MFSESSRERMRAGEQVPIGLVARDDLKPQLGHLVGRALPERHALRRAVRIAGIPVRVVIVPARGDDRAGRQEHRRGIAIHVLPIEIPVPDVEQRLLRAVGKRREALDFSRQVVSVRLHGVEVEIDRQRERAGHDPLLPGRDLEILTRQPEQRRHSRRRRVGQVEANAHLDGLFLAARTQMQHQDEVAVRLHREGHPVRRDVRRVPRGPVEKVSVRRHRRVSDQAFVPRFVDRARRGAATRRSDRAPSSRDARPADCRVAAPTL